MYEHEFEATGTKWQVSTARALSTPEVAAIEREVAEFEDVYSRFKANSAISRLAADGGSYTFPTRDTQMWEFYDLLFAATDGGINPLVGDSLAALGYDAGYSLSPQDSVPTPSAWTSVTRTGSTLTLPHPALLDVGALGKGRLVDIVFDLLRDFGHDEVTVDAGGDLRHLGAPLRVALEHPDNPDLAIGVVSISDGAICGSAANRRQWDSDLHHLLDARTGQPVAHPWATWATAATTMVADGLATAVLHLPNPQPLVANYGTGWAKSDGKHWQAGGDLTTAMNTEN